MSPRYARPPDESDLARLMRVRVTLPSGDPYEFNVHDVARIDQDNLLNEIAGQPQRYMIYALLHVDAKDALRLAQRALKDRLAARSDAVREELTTTNDKGTVKGPTETHVKQTVEAEPEHRKLQTEIDRLESLEDRMGAIREGLTERRDMLTAASMFRAPEASPKAEDRATSRMRRRDSNPPMIP